MQARISEIFLSYQGEGPFTGSKQLFVRFYGCNMECSYCDTPLESYKSFSKESLLGKILDFGDNYNELVLTGGLEAISIILACAPMMVTCNQKKSRNSYGHPALTCLVYRPVHRNSYLYLRHILWGYIHLYNIVI